jgi:hypothetical protein
MPTVTSARIVAAIILVVGLAISASAAKAALYQDSDVGQVSGCGFVIYAEFETNPFGAPRIRSYTDADCADRTINSMYYWNVPTSSLLGPYVDGWNTDGYAENFFPFSGPNTDEVWGYGQIQEPTSTYSSTKEAHPFIP